MSRFAIAGGRPVHGRLRVPGDKSISHRALLLGALAEGTSTVRGLSAGEDVARTRAAVESMGAVVDGERVTGGRSRLREPHDIVDTANSGTTMRLLTGVCATVPGLAVLTGDASLRRRPMDRVVEPLRQMGADIDGRDGGRLPPLVVRGGDLKGIEYGLPVPSAQVKAAVLLAGLAAEGETVVHEQVRTRAHTEEMLARFGADVVVTDGGLTTRVRPSAVQPFEITVPGDPSQAAFWLVAACLVPGSDVVVEDVYIGPARAGFLDVLARMGATVTPEPGGLRATYAGPLKATEVGGDEVPGLIDEIPVLAVAAAIAEGTTVIRGAAELRVKESDRIATVAEQLTAMGARIEVQPDGLVIHGRPGGLRPSSVESHGDHRLAMALAVAALAAEGVGDTVVDGWEAVGTSYPGFEVDLERLCVVVAIDGPVGSGKSTVAKAVGERLDLRVLETGAMYRAIAVAALRHGLDPERQMAEVIALARQAVVEVGDRVHLNGEDITGELRAEPVNRSVSVVAADPGVREALVAQQRAWAEANGGGVIEGRDIGTVVFPDAAVKVFLTASAEERARRRGPDEDPAGLARRDHLDSTRATSPLVAAPDALLIDSTGRSVDEIVDEIVARWDP